MKTIKAIKFIFPSLFLFGLISCDLSDSNSTEFKVIPEVLLLKKKMDETTKYALAYYAYSNKTIESASVLPPFGSSPIELESYENGLITFAKVPGENDFQAAMPDIGQYNFTVQNTEGEIFNDYDMLADNFIDVPQFSKIIFDKDNLTIRIEWSPVIGSDKYFVRLLNSNGETIYTGYEVDTDSTGYTLRTSDDGWTQTPNNGENYTLQLNAVAYEDNIDLNEYFYHVNTISIAESAITWNPN